MTLFSLRGTRNYHSEWWNENRCRKKSRK